MAEMDLELFRKKVRLFDSENEGERNSSFRQALLQTSGNGLLFWEACELAFGGQKDTGETDQLKAETDQLKSEIERLNGELAEIAGAYNNISTGSGWPAHLGLDATTMASPVLICVLAEFFMGWEVFGTHFSYYRAMLHSVTQVFFILWGVCVWQTLGARVFFARLSLWWCAWAFYIGLDMANGHLRQGWLSLAYYLTPENLWNSNCIWRWDSCDISIVPLMVFMLDSNNEWKLLRGITEMLRGFTERRFAHE